MQILLGAGQFILVTAVAFVLLVAVVSHIRFQVLTRKAEEAGTEELDPHEAFQATIAHRLGTMHREPEPFIVMLVRPRDLDAVREQHGEAVAEELVAVFEERVRSAVRTTDRIDRVHGDTVGIVLGASRGATEIIAARIMAAVRHEPLHCRSGLVQPVAAAIGHAAHPEDGERVRVLLGRAEEVLDSCETNDAGVQGPASGEEAWHGEEEMAPAQARVVDRLTGLLRPERVGRAVQKYVARFRRQEKPVSLLLIDVDHLARYNEHYGRGAGDAILKGIGEYLQDGVREGDLPARLSGEEFLVAMPCSPADALVAGQRVVGEIKKRVFPFEESRLKATVSVGVAGYPDHGGNPRYLLEAADMALSAAKENGRNMCMLYDDSMQPRVVQEKTPDVF